MKSLLQMKVISVKYYIFYAILFNNNINFNSNGKVLSKSRKFMPNFKDFRSDHRKETTLSLRVDQMPDHWTYGEDWAEHGFEICGDSSQSPIRLNSTKAVLKEDLRLFLRNYDKPIKTAYIENNGHTVQMGTGSRFKAYIHGSAAANRVYIFAQLHFHWGSYNGVGSEHTIDGYRGPLEIHFVHYNKKYRDFDTAVDKPDGLMVLGALFKITSRNNTYLSKIIKLVKNVPKFGDKAFLLQKMRLRSLLPRKLRPFYIYSGSLTTPPCYQSVRWLVFRKKVSIGQRQNKQFRKCRGEAWNVIRGRRQAMQNNFRPLQPLNKREVSFTP